MEKNVSENFHLKTFNTTFPFRKSIAATLDNPHKNTVNTFQSSWGEK